MFSRNRFENDLTRTLLSSERSWPNDVEVILLHNDFTPTLKAAPEPLKRYILYEVDGKRHIITALFQLALHGQSLRPSIMATRTLAQPKCNFMNEIASTNEFKDGLLEFLASPDSRNPVHVGHFGTIFLAGLRCVPETLGNDVLTTIVTHCYDQLDILGWQEFLSFVLLDWGPRWCGNENHAPGFAGLAKAIGTAYVRKRWAIVVGFFNALLTFVKEQMVTGLHPAMYEISFIRELTEATFQDPINQTLVLELGVDLISRIIDGLENPVDDVDPPPEGQSQKVAQYLKAYGMAFARRFHAENQKWGSKHEDLSPEQLVMLKAFPVLWEGLIDWVYPVFFWDHPFSVEFNLAFLKRVQGLERSKLLELAAKLIPALPKDAIVVPASREAHNSIEKIVKTNGHIVLLGDLLANSQHVSEDHCETWDKLSPIIAEKVLRYLQNAPQGEPA